MKQTIYIDVLISINLFINYFLLLSVAKILTLKPERKRIILSSFIGSLYSLVILLPSINIVLSLFIKLIMSVTIVILAFEITSIKVFFKILGTFYGINFLFGGIVFFLWYFVSPNNIFVNNNMIYFNLSPLFLVLSTFAAYISIRLMNKFTSNKNIGILSYNLLIKNKDKTAIVKAKVDTGSTLREPFSNIPVIVVQHQEIEDIIPESLKFNFYNEEAEHKKNFDIYDDFSFNGFRLVPFKTISGEGLLPAFKPDYIKILSKSQNVKKEAYVAICDKKIFNNEYHALINPDLIE